jgi:hypothetical protein
MDSKEEFYLQYLLMWGTESVPKGESVWPRFKFWYETYGYKAYPIYRNGARVRQLPKDSSVLTYNHAYTDYVGWRSRFREWCAEQRRKKILSSKE